jgi:hypothetical protein
VKKRDCFFRPWCFGFLHCLLSVWLLPNWTSHQPQYFPPIITPSWSFGWSGLIRVSTIGLPVRASANSLCKVFAGSGALAHSCSTIVPFVSPYTVITIPDLGPPATIAGFEDRICQPCAYNISVNWFARLLGSSPIATYLISTVLSRPNLKFHQRVSGQSFVAP